MKTTTLKPKPAKKRTAATELAQRWPAFVAWKTDNRALLALPLPPNLANARMHWRAKDAARKKYFSQCNTLVQLGLLPGGDNPERAAVRVLVVSRNAMDYDNATARIKWALDWLRSNGYLRDDNKKAIAELVTTHRTQKEDGGVPRVVFEIEGLPGVEAARGTM